VARFVDSMLGLIKSTLGPAINVRVDVASDLAPAKGDANQLDVALLKAELLGGLNDQPFHR
jgi:hypothetical protein